MFPFKMFYLGCVCDFFPTHPRNQGQNWIRHGLVVISSHHKEKNNERNDEDATISKQISSKKIILYNPSTQDDAQ